MKNFKKLMALVIAGAMVVGSMSLTTFGADPIKDGTIEVTGLKPGDTVNFYKIVGWVNDGADNVGGWKAETAYASILDSTTLAKVIDPDETGYTGLTSDMAGKLSRVSATPVNATPISVGNDGKASLTLAAATGDSELGMYMAIITPADANTVYNPVFVSADWNVGDNTWNVTQDSTYYGKSAAKSSTVKLTKEFENDDDYNGDDGATAAIGDVITFTVTTTVPGYGHTFDQPTFTIKDTMDNLEFLSISSVKAAGETLDTGNYSIAGKNGTGQADATGYSVILTPEYLRTLAVPTELVIVYTAKVTKEAQLANIEKETNTVTLEFSHDPSTETTPGNDEKQYKKDKTNHYTFSIDADNLWKGSKTIGQSGSELIKISVDRNGNPIYSETEVHSYITTEEYEASPFAGAKFALYKVEDQSGWVKESEPFISDVESDANGRIKFEGLDAGRYILVETSAPSGFIRDTSEHKIEITSQESMVKKLEYYDQAGNWYNTEAEATQGAASLENTKVTPFEYEINELDWYKITFDGEEVATHTFMHKSESTAIEWSSSESRELPASIHNTKGVELPSTGGMGTTLFYAIGVVLVLGAGILLVSKRRMAAN